MNVWLAAGGTAALMSERGRQLLRRGAVYGLAGAITVGEAVASAAKSVAEEAEHVASSGRDMASDLVSEARQSRDRAPGAAAQVAPSRPRRRPQAKKASRVDRPLGDESTLGTS